MRTPDSWIVVGLDCGGTSNNATVLDASGRFLVDRLVEVPSLVQEGPEVAVGALVRAFDQILELTGTTRASVRALGLDTPGPASADGVISSKGATNFSQPAWRGFDFRGALEAKVGLPVVYNNDANAAALYAHHVHFGAKAAQHSSVSAIVGTGLGGGVIEAGRIVRTAAAPVQLRLLRRRRERRVPVRNRKEPAPLLADPVRGPPARRRRAAGGGRQAGPRLR